MLWKELSRDAKNVIEWVEDPYTGKKKEITIVISNNPYTNPTDQDLNAFKKPFIPFAYDFIGISYTFGLFSLSFTKSLYIPTNLCSCCKYNVSKIQNRTIGTIQIKRNKEFFVSAKIASKAAIIAMHQPLA